MVRTLNTLRFIVIGMALALAVLAAPAANAQSVTGSGQFIGFGSSGAFKVNVSIGSDGSTSGSVTVKVHAYDPMPGDYPNDHWVKYAAVSLVVVGNVATVTAYDPGGALQTFQFTDNGDGSTYPDYIGLLWSVTKGDFTVTP